VSTLTGDEAGRRVEADLQSERPKTKVGSARLSRRARVEADEKESSESDGRRRSFYKHVLARDGDRWTRL
jgi:hypothetical protein